MTTRKEDQIVVLVIGAFALLAFAATFAILYTVA